MIRYLFDLAIVFREHIQNFIASTERNLIGQWHELWDRIVQLIALTEFSTPLSLYAKMHIAVSFLGSSNCNTVLQNGCTNSFNQHVSAAITTSGAGLLTNCSSMLRSQFNAALAMEPPRVPTALVDAQSTNVHCSSADGTFCTRFCRKTPSKTGAKSVASTCAPNAAKARPRQPVPAEQDCQQKRARRLLAPAPSSSTRLWHSKLPKKSGLMRSASMKRHELCSKKNA